MNPITTFRGVINALHLGLAAHLLPPLLLSQVLAAYVERIHNPAIGLHVLGLGLTFYAALILGNTQATKPSPQWRVIGLATALLLAQTLFIATHYDRPLMPLLALSTLFLYWANHCPPLHLTSRGGGEIVQALGLGLLLPLIGYYAQTGVWHSLPRAYFLPYILMQFATAIALGFAHRDADIEASKKSLPVLLGYRKAAALAVAICLLAKYQLVWTRGFPLLGQGLMLLAVAALLAGAPWLDRLDNSPAHRRAFTYLVLSPSYIYVIGFFLAKLWYSSW